MLDHADRRLTDQAARAHHVGWPQAVAQPPRRGASMLNQPLTRIFAHVSDPDPDTARRVVFSPRARRGDVILTTVPAMMRVADARACSYKEISRFLARRSLPVRVDGRHFVASQHALVASCMDRA